MRGGKKLAAVLATDEVTVGASSKGSRFRFVCGARHAKSPTIAATHRDLEAAVETATFREDLYHRLHKVVLRLPPLRAHIEDLPLLVQHFLAQFNQRHGLAVRGVTRQALRLLERYPWRGNVRQLGDVLEPAAIRTKREWITAEYFDLPVRQGTDVHGASAAASGQALTAAKDRLGWLQREALRIASERREIRRQDLIAVPSLPRPCAARTLVILAGRRLLGASASVGPRGICLCRSRSGSR